MDPAITHKMSNRGKYLSHIYIIYIYILISNYPDEPSGVGIIKYNYYYYNNIIPRIILLIIRGIIFIYNY